MQKCSDRFGPRMVPLFRSLVLSALLLLGSCGALVEYSDQLIDESSGRSAVVTKTASLGGIIGFVLGVPLDILGLPITYVVYTVQKDEEEEGVDPLSTILFPSFVLWRTGTLALGTPFDVMEFAFYRAWARPAATRDGDLELTDPESSKDGQLEQKQG